MQYEDRIRVSTPEGIDLELTLAGLGSRVAAAVIDACIRGVLYIAIFWVLAQLADLLELGTLMIAIYIPVIFLVETGYDILFETLSSGQTPGKRMNGLRVLRADGGPVELRTSAVRNILRIVDGIATGFIAGTLSVLISPKNQRLGDLAAGTVVVRDRRRPIQQAGHLIYREHPTLPDFVAWDASAVTTVEMAAVRRFLDRRATLSPDHRRRIAADLASRLQAKVAGAPSGVPAEAFLEALREAKLQRD